MKNLKVLVLMALCMMAASCVTQKKLTYLHDVTAESADSINKHFNVQREGTIAIGDQLNIFVTSMDPEATAPFNINENPRSAVSGTGTANGARSNLYYTVEPDSTINFPILGPIKVAGMKRTELQQHLASLIEPMVHNVIVTVRNINTAVTVLGEVSRPGRFVYSTETLTLFDALALAGDMTPYGKRNTVLISREVGGKMEFARLNLNTDEIYASPYFYLHQNDVIYVEPNIVRAINSQNISLYMSMITTTASLATVIVSITMNAQTLKARADKNNS